MKAWPSITEVRRILSKTETRRALPENLIRVWSVSCSQVYLACKRKVKKRFARATTLSLDSGFARKRTTAQLGQSTTSGKG